MARRRKFATVSKVSRLCICSSGEGLEHRSVLPLPTRTVLLLLFRSHHLHLRYLSTTEQRSSANILSFSSSRASLSSSSSSSRNEDDDENDLKEALFLENDFCVEEEVNLPKNDLERNRENDDKDDDEEEETEEEEEEHVVVGFIIIIFALFTRRQTQSVIRVRV